MSEMTKLREALDKNNIEWIDRSDTMFTRTHFIIDGTEYSVICGWYSYGGQEGLLEYMPPVKNFVDDDVEGYLTADDIINNVIKK